MSSTDGTNNKKRKASQKVMKGMQKVRQLEKEYTQKRDNDFRMLIILCESDVNKFSMKEDDHVLCKHFKDFTMDQNVNTDFVQQAFGDAENNSKFFQWEPIEHEGSGMKLENLYGIIPIWAFLVCVLLCVGVESSHIEFDHSALANCERVVEKVKKMVRFTTSNEMGRVANSSLVQKDSIASEIGSNFEMVVVTGGQEFYSYGKGRCEGKPKKLYDFLASDLAATHGVSDI